MLREKFDNYFSLIERDGKDGLYQYLEGSGYFEAPASSQYHLAGPGGLVEHSLNVTDAMFAVTKAMDFEVDVESLTIVGLFHDIGKAGYYGKPNYVENILKSGKRSDAKPYEVNKEILAVPHEISAIHILSQFINLTEDEVFAIIYHNGLYTNTGYTLKGKETALYLITHFADMWASRVVER